METFLIMNQVKVEFFYCKPAANLLLKCISSGCHFAANVYSEIYVSIFPMLPQN